MNTDCKDTIENTGNGTPLLDTCGLFNDLDLLHNSLEDPDILDQRCPDQSKYPFSLLDELYYKSPLETVPLESACVLDSPNPMDNPFFEQFMDLDQLFPELPLVDTLKLGFEVEEASPVVTSDICQSDVVTVETDECFDVASPCSDLIDAVTVDGDAELPSLGDDITDMALSPEYTVDVVTVDEGSSLAVDNSTVSVETVTNLLDSDQAEPTSQPAAEITVIETSHPLTLLTQELTQTSSSPDTSELPLSTLSVDLGELFAFSDTLGLANTILPPADDSGESEVGPCEIPVEPKPWAERKRACSPESSKPPTKKAKQGDDVNCCSELDRRTIRRLKNNVASKHARAARKQKEHELFKQEAELEKSNAELRKQLQELELLTTSLRKVLVEKLSGVTCPV